MCSIDTIEPFDCQQVIYLSQNLDEKQNLRPKNEVYAPQKKCYAIFLDAI